jgi:thiamine biosynthesis lipoprotein
MRGLVGLALTTLILTGCRPAEDALMTERLFVMATWVDISLPASARERYPDLITEIEAELREFEVDYYAWGEGELADLNRALTDGLSLEVTDALGALLETALDITHATDGAFDPGVGTLVELWGFNDETPRDSPPDPDTIAATLEASGSITELTLKTGDRFEVSRATGNAAESDQPAVRRFTLDLGGIAKGTAVDSIVTRLEALGIAPALVNAGGDLRVIGAPPDRDWRIGIAAPRAGGLLGTIGLRDGEAAFTSGDYERFFEHEEDRFHHILDPRTGFPVTHTQAVTVIAETGTLADAAATALFVAGPDAWLAVAAELGVVAVLRVDASGTIEMTPSMRQRLQTSAEVGSDIIITAD